MATPLRIPRQLQPPLPSLRGGSGRRGDGDGPQPGCAFQQLPMGFSGDDRGSFRGCIQPIDRRSAEAGLEDAVARAMGREALQLAGSQ
jgi:hypothetical protein